METCVPESIKGVTFCPSTMMEASLHHPLGGKLGLGLGMGQLGSLLMNQSIGLSSYWTVFVQGWDRNVRELLLAGAAVTGRG